LRRTAFTALVTEEDFAALGFESLEEVADAQLGEPLQVSAVPLDRLKEFTPETDPNELLVEANRIIYPVTVNEEVCSRDLCRHPATGRGPRGRQTSPS